MGAQEVGKTVKRWLAGGWNVAVARVTEVRGIGSAADGELFACNEIGETSGDLLGGAVLDPVRAAAGKVLANDPPGRIQILQLRVGNAEVARAGLCCGGAVTVAVQNTSRIPWQFWSVLSEQKPVALATVIDCDDATCGSLVTFDGAGCFGSLGDPDLDRTVEAIVRGQLETANSGMRVLDDSGRTVMVEAFVPEPRLVIVGGGTLADTIVSQAQALGWAAVVAADEEHATDALDWAGTSAALVILSHKPELDAPV